MDTMKDTIKITITIRSNGPITIEVDPDIGKNALVTALQAALNMARQMN